MGSGSWLPPSHIHKALLKLECVWRRLFFPAPLHWWTKLTCKVWHIAWEMMTVHRAGQNRQQLNRNTKQIEFTPSCGSWVEFKISSNIPSNLCFCLVLGRQKQNSERNFHIQITQTLTSKPNSRSMENNSWMKVKEIQIFSKGEIFAWGSYCSRDKTAKKNKLAARSATPHLEIPIFKLGLKDSWSTQPSVSGPGPVRTAASSSLSGALITCGYLLLLNLYLLYSWLSKCTC